MFATVRRWLGGGQQDGTPPDYRFSLAVGVGGILLAVANLR